MNKNILWVGIAIITIIILAIIYKQSYKSPASEPVETNSVAIQGYFFDPPNIVVKKGTTVTWTNKDSIPHQVASDPHPAHTDLPGLASSILNQNQTYSLTFDKAGKFGYHCHIHPTIHGTVTVEE